jgi:hypothetical protein
MREQSAKDGLSTMRKMSMMLVVSAAVCAMAGASGRSSYFSDSEKARIAAFWHTPGRFVISAPPEARTKGPWQIRLTPEGSTWLYNYNKARGLGKVAPGTIAAPRNAEEREWENWINAKIACDRWVAGRAVAEANSRFLGKDMPNPAGAPVDDPGATPAGLASLVGEAPAFAAAVAPSQYTTNYPDGSSCTLTDNPQMRARYAYYRFPQGVMAGGSPVKSMSMDQLSSLFEEAGLPSSAQRVMKAVSMLEGGFDSVNTYDTGFVSVGLIQFACLSKGSGSLGAVLMREKNETPEAFAQDFHRYGIDVEPDGSLVALDADTGAVVEGTAAARKIISDKRLISVFQHAGRMSRSFQVAQLRVAKDQYYPSEDTIKVTCAGQAVVGRVCDFVHSEAAMATLMDRKVNTGNINPLPAVLSQIGTQNGCKSPSDFAYFEKDVLTAIKYRKDYTQNDELSQPSEGLPRRTSASANRHMSSRSSRYHHFKSQRGS